MRYCSSRFLIKSSISSLEGLEVIDGAIDSRRGELASETVTLTASTFRVVDNRVVGGQVIGAGSEVVAFAVAGPVVMEKGFGMNIMLDTSDNSESEALFDSMVTQTSRLIVQI